MACCFGGPGLNEKILLHLGGLPCLFCLSRTSSSATVLRSVCSHFCRHHRGSHMVLFAVA